MSDVTTSAHFAIVGNPPVSSWCLSRGKRVFDVVFAVVLLILASPLMVLAALIIKATSPGPIMFRQSRVGQHGRIFSLRKFRSMTVHSSDGSNLTRRGDLRVTKVGRILRSTKVDELPQIYNVLLGDLSVVGPRPDVPEFIDTLHGELRSVLLLKPGITSVASVEFRNEESVLSLVPPDQLRSFYINILLPDKVARDLKYARGAGFGSDLRVIARTAAALLS